MKHTNKIISTALALALILSLPGCMADPTVETPTPGTSIQPGAVSPAPIATEPPFARGMRIALCTSQGTVDDRGHNAACYEGILNFIVSRNIIDSVTPFQESTGDPDRALQFLRELSVNYDVLVCVGPVFRKTATLAKEEPEKYFIVMDAETDAQAENLCSVRYAEEQCGFFAGIVAAMETRTGHIAIINSLPNDSNTRYYFGFRSGVAYTNGNFSTAAEVIDLPEYAGINENGVYLGGNFTQNPTGQSTAYSIAQSLIGLDCDVLFVAADTASAGAYTAVSEHEDIWAIGAENDQYIQGEVDGRNFILTSVTKNLSLETEARLNSIVQGTFTGGSVYLTAANSALGYVSANDHQQLGEKTLQVLADAYPMMQDGTIVPGTGPQ